MSIMYVYLDYFKLCICERRAEMSHWQWIQLAELSASVTHYVPTIVELLVDLEDNVDIKED